MPRPAKDRNLRCRSTSSYNCAAALQANNRSGRADMGFKAGLGFVLTGALVCAAPAYAADAAAQKAELRKVCDEALATLYKAKPEMKARVSKAPGYGCF